MQLEEQIETSMDNGNNHFEVGFQEAALKEKNLTTTKLN